jgi:hypothetical protein
VSFIDPARSSTARLRAIPPARFAARPPRLRRERFRKWRGLPVGRPPRLVELSLESLILAAQLIAFALDPFQFMLQPLALDLGALRPLAPLGLAR